MNAKDANEIELKLEAIINRLTILNKEKISQELIKLANHIDPVKFSGNERRGFNAFKRQAG